MVYVRTDVVLQCPTAPRCGGATVTQAGARRTELPRDMVRRQADQPRTEILHVRLSPEERERLKAAADAEYLDQSAWARRAILLALDADARQNARTGAGTETPRPTAETGGTADRPGTRSSADARRRP